MNVAPGIVARTSQLGVSFANGAHVVRGVDLTLRTGEIVALVGESGSGKTMLGLSLLGLAPAEAALEGEAWLQGTDMVGADAEQRRIARRRHAGAVFQDPMTSLNPTMRIGRQVAEAASSAAAADEALELVGFPEPKRRSRQYPHELSGGLRQRVMIAMAIARRPSVVLLDEPTTALDVTLQAAVLRLLGRLRDELGLAMLFITHDLAVAAQIADRVMVMYGGRIAEAGAPRDVLTTPSHPYTASLLASRRALAVADLHAEVAMLRGEPPDPRRLPPGCPYAPRCVHVREMCTSGPPPPLRSSSVHDGANACQRSSELDLRPAGGRRDVLPDPAARAAPGEAPVLTFRDVRKAFRTGRRAHPAVAGVNLEIARGSAVALVGSSGCGKTTLLRMAVGLERPDGGEVRHAAGGRPQMVFQDAGASLTPWLTVGRMLQERLRAERLAKTEIRDRVERSLSMVGLPADVADARPRELSGGQRQRVALARAIIVPPTLLACDEPTSALDASLAIVVIDLLRNLRRELDLTLLFVTHDLAVARAVADEIAVMAAGAIVEQGPSDTIMACPATPPAQELVDAMPTLERSWQ